MIPKSRPDLRIQDMMNALRLGDAKTKFEESVANLAGADYGLSFSFAHASFLALIKALDMKDAEIILPTYTSQVMAEAVYATGNTPVFVDIDLDDYNMDLDEIRKALTPRTRMIVATHIYGSPMSVPAIRRLAEADRIFVVEDCAMSFPGATRGEDGLQSDAALFSFGPGKPLFAVRGGVIAVKDPRLFERLSMVRKEEMSQMTRSEWYKRWVLLGIHYALTKGFVTDLALGRGLSKQSVVGITTQMGIRKDKEQVFDEPELPSGFDAPFTEFQAQVGLSQLQRADWMMGRRRAQAALYTEMLRGIPGIVLPPTHENSSFSHYTIRVTNRDAIGFRERLLEQGIETGRTFSYVLGSIPTRPYGKGFYPRADQASREVVNLPISLNLTHEQTSRIAHSIRRIMEDNCDSRSRSTVLRRVQYESTAKTAPDFSLPTDQWSSSAGQA